MRTLGMVPPWLRRGLEAGVIAALVALVTLLGSTAGAAGRISLPEGPAGSLLLAPAVLALGVITVGYPVAFAATRGDAFLGAVVAFLLSAEAVAILVNTRVILAGVDPTRDIALGVLAGWLALGPVVVGLAAGQLATPLGFGRRAGAVTTIASGALAAVVLVIASRLG